MIKRITKLGWLTIIVIVGLILTGMSQFTHSEPKTAMNQLQRKTEIQPKEKVPSKYTKVHIMLETKKTGAYYLSIQTPQTTSETINNEVEQWIEKQREDFLEVIEKDDSSDNADTPSLHITLETHKVTDNYYQLHITKKETNEQDFTKVFNVDIENDRLLTLDNMLDMNDDTLKTIQNQAKVAWSNLEDTDITDEQLKEILTSPDKWNWSIDPDAVTLYIDEPETSENEEEPVPLHIPLDTLYLNLNEEIDTFIDMSNAQQAEMDDAIQAEKERLEKERKKKEREEKAAKEKAKQKEKERQKADADGKYVALSFDDGPSAEVTPRVLNILAEHNATATFFMLGNQVDSYPEVAKQVANAGHEIGNHTVDHKDLTTLGPDAIHGEINNAADKIEHATGTRPYLVRTPYGAYNDAVINDAANNGNALALWSVDSLDWQSRNADAVNSEIQKEITSGAIVLMHDIHPTTADALPELLTTLEKEGYQFVTVSQLLELQGQDGVGPYYGYVK